MTEEDREEGVAIYSWRDVFQRSWRVHAILGWRPNIPGGIDLLIVAWFTIIAAAITAADYAPGTSTLLGFIPWLPRHVVLPMYIAWLATSVTPDDRSAPRYALARARHRLGRVTPLELAPAPERIPVLHDATGAGPQPGRIVGVADVTFNTPVRLGGHGNVMTAKGDPDGVTGPVVLCSGTVLEVRS